MRSGGAIRKRWRIPNGKSESGLFSNSELRRWEPPPKSIKDRSLGPGEQVRLCTDTYEIYGPPQT
jgi:hypothetical protein